jgi:hypothetical protein
VKSRKPRSDLIIKAESCLGIEPYVLFTLFNLKQSGEGSRVLWPGTHAKGGEDWREITVDICSLPPEI